MPHIGLRRKHDLASRFHSCTVKKVFGTWQEAEDCCLHILFDEPALEVLHAYKCRFCPGWHMTNVTHAPWRKKNYFGLYNHVFRQAYPAPEPHPGCVAV